MKTEYYIGTSQVSKEVYDTVQVYKKDNLLLAYENDKYKKAVKIIKTKRVDVQLLKDSKNLNDYNWCVHTKVRALTKKEYEFLKEVFKL